VSSGGRAVGGGKVDTAGTETVLGLHDSENRIPTIAESRWRCIWPHWQRTARAASDGRNATRSRLQIGHLTCCIRTQVRIHGMCRIHT
jgi:hypothetical protein